MLRVVGCHTHTDLGMAYTQCASYSDRVTGDSGPHHQGGVVQGLIRRDGEGKGGGRGYPGTRGREGRGCRHVGRRGVCTQYDTHTKQTDTWGATPSQL